MWSTTPRFSEISAIMSPMYSFGQMTKALTIGSSICSDVVRLGQKGGVVNFLDGAVGHRHAVNHAGISGDDVHVVFAAEAFLDDFQMQQAEKTAAEAEAERDGTFRLITRKPSR